MMEIKLINGCIYGVNRVDVTNGRLEIDIKDKSAEEIQEIFSKKENLQNIELLTEAGDKFAVLTGWTVYAGLTMYGDVKTAILMKEINKTEERITEAHLAALEAKAIVEDLKENGVPAEESPEMKAAILVARIQAQNFTDEQAVQVKDLYDDWSGESVDYKAGTYLLYNGVLYKVLKGHTSQIDWTPDTATSLYAKVLTSLSGEVLPWEQPDATNAYMQGDRVLHNGKTWESEADNNVWEPGAVGAPWKEVTV